MSSYSSEKQQSDMMSKPTTAEIASAKPASKGDPKTASKMHRRSRSGCFTCRLRRKKCEEGKPGCKACKHLGLRCDYKRPPWWSNSEQRRQQKELIKELIKNTQLAKKSAPVQPHDNHQLHHSGAGTPPSLCHSAPTSVDYYQQDSSLPQSRAASIDSPFSTPYGFTHISSDGYFGAMQPPHPMSLSHPQFPAFSPYEVDIKTERQIFVNDVPTRRDSTISTFSTYQPPAMLHGIPAYPTDSWLKPDYFESQHETTTTTTTTAFAEEPVDFNFFEFPHGTRSPGHEAVIDVDECDKYLLNHFLEKVLKLIFPILDANQHGSARSDVILPALESNSAYLHCCLSISATHMKATEGLTGEQIDNDIVRHRYAAVSELCEALGADIDHAGILEATLGMIFFQCTVGRPNDALPDIPWHQHFQAATSLVHKLELPAAMLDPEARSQAHPPFNMTLAAWIDILGSTMLGRSPAFADTYRELNMMQRSAGLAELMGCDDRIMFLISEVACLDAQKGDGMNEVVLCKYVESLANEIGAAEAAAAPVQTCFSPTGAIRPKQLGINVTAVFRVAARIYLCTLVPGYEPRQPSMCHLISQFAELMNYIPVGAAGFDRSLAWPLLVAGAASVAGSPFRAMFAERCLGLADAANFGSFGRVRELLRDIWLANDAAAARGEHEGVSWRAAMAHKGWDFLLM